ncbi:response regulator [Bradyrhizobium genosp. L]|nr:response regulator [Bradyrhizobium genosp. L]
MVRTGRWKAHAHVNISRRKAGVVLVVEDEFLIRLNAVDMIRQAGFDTIEATDADQAILILESRNDIVAVFTDVQMPGSMDGLRLARTIRGRWPPVKIIATSGDVTVGLQDIPEGGRFLSKPYTQAQVTAAIAEAC